MISNWDDPSPEPEKTALVTELADPCDLAPHISGSRKTVVFFEKNNCPYCVPYKSRFADLVSERSADIDFVKVKLDNPGNPLWERYNIPAVPAFIAFSRGEIVARADSILALGLSKRKWADFCAGI